MMTWASVYSIDQRERKLKKILILNNSIKRRTTISGQQFMSLSLEKLIMGYVAPSAAIKLPKGDDYYCGSFIFITKGWCRFKVVSHR